MIHGPGGIVQAVRTLLLERARPSFFKRNKKNDKEICGALLTSRARFKYLPCTSALSPHKHNLKSHPFRHGPHAHGSMIMIP
jgi:hypothetical protein